MSKIHPTAVIAPEAEIDEDVEVGAFCVIEGPVHLASGIRLLPGAQVLGDTIIGANTVVGRGAVIGDLPQDVNFDPTTPSGVTIGEQNTFRENVTIHRGGSEGTRTTMGSGNFLMVNTHLGHDVQMGDGNILANNSGFGGHCTVGDNAFVGGGALFHQFIRVGSSCMVQGNASISQDVPPYCMAAGLNQLHGLNVIGLRRAGFSPAERSELKALYKELFLSSKLLKQAVESATLHGDTMGAAAGALLEFVSAPSSKGCCSPTRG